MARIGVVGAGVMGADIALTLAAYGHDVVLKDIDAGALERFRKGLVRQLRGYRMMGAELPCWSAEEILARIALTRNDDGFERVSWVIENVPEDPAIKAGVYDELRAVCGAETYYAVNTSCIPITRLAAPMPDPGRVLGAHFMNPVPLKRGVEVIRGHHCTQETIDAAKVLLASIGKIAIVVEDSPGFVANRLSHLFMNEAAFLVHERVAEPAAIDAIFREGYGHKMGPLETADLIGLDTVVQSLDVLYRDFQDPKFRCCPLLRRMVDAGLLGNKSGRGFYEYGR